MGKITRKIAELCTLGNIEDAFITAKIATGLTEKTIRDYRSTYAIFGNTDTPITAVDSQAMQQWILSLNGKKVTTINHYVRNMRVLLYWAMDEGYLQRYTIHLVRGQEPTIRLYSVGDLEKLLVKPKKSDSFTTWRDWAIINTFLATGCRAGTLCEIHVSDVDFRDNNITYRHLKTKNTAIVPMSMQLKVALTDYLALFNITDFLFPLQTGEQNNPRSIRCSMLTYFKQRGVDYNGLHTFRHTYAKLYINNGGNAFTLQRMLCHSDITMTQRYVHLFSDDLKNGYDNISPLDNLTAKKPTRKKV